MKSEIKKQIEAKILLLTRKRNSILQAFRKKLEEKKIEQIKNLLR